VTTQPPTWNDLRGSSPIAFFDLGGWSAVLAEHDDQLWVGVRRGGDNVSVEPAETIATAIRHYSSLLHQALTRESAPAATP
jgi:hypothetical protein